MSVIVQCPACKASYQVGDQYAGHTVQCPKCSAAFLVPAIVPIAHPTAAASQPLWPGGAVKAVPPPLAARENVPADAADDASFIAGLAVPSPMSAARRSHKKKQGFPAWLIAIIAAVGAAAIAGFGSAIYWSNQLRTNAQAKADSSKADNSKTESSKTESSKTDKSKIVASSSPIDSGTKRSNAESKPKVPLLTIAWPEDQRADASLFVNDEQTRFPAAGAIEIPLPPAKEKYEFRLHRPGFRTKEFALAYQDIDQSYTVSEWEPLRPMEIKMEAGKVRETAVVSPTESGDPPRLAGDDADDQSPGPKTGHEGARLRPLPSPVAVAASTQGPAVAAADDDGQAELDHAILDLGAHKKLLAKNEYPALRALYARHFEAAHKASIRQAYSPDYDAMAGWLDRHVEIKEEFYTAIDEQHDDVPAALKIFHNLFKRYPERMEAFGNLAIAVAVTWDQPKRGVYDYGGHQRATKSQMPAEREGEMENFDYYSGGPRSVRERVQLLPWEFLVHLVNHRTPAAERAWAVQNYLPGRVMYGKCYHDVPYDNEMLNSNFATARLNDKAYTLENIRRYGGVCAMQADFAARVGKSMAVPAEYVGGESAYKDRHAWVMWVELQNVTKSSINFSLQSHGRYQGDKYYVGKLVDPHTGVEITDRQLELRLQGVGMSPTAHRQVSLVMKAFPQLRQGTKMSVAEQLNFLYQAVKLSPWNEDPWIALAGMSRDGRVGKDNVPQMMVALEKLYATFAAFPDFTWTVFDDLISFQHNAKLRSKLYGRLVTMYEQAGRPDLSCEARLKYTEYLVADEKYKEAVEGLAYTIKKFPDEGRYVPKMLDKLEAICGKHAFPHAQEQLVQFYEELLPVIPPTRDNRPSQFCMEMYQRAIDRFKSAGRADLAVQCSTLLARLKAKIEQP